MRKTLDVREIAPAERHPKIIASFSALLPGESFILVNDHDPKPLLYQFQAELDGRFDWWPLEQGPDRWRVEVAKRRDANPERTVTEFLQADHKRLDTIFGRFKEATGTGMWEEAASAIAEFNLGLRRHIRAEEEILFPVFEEKTGMTEAGPTFVMKEEHKEIHNLLDRLVAGSEMKDQEVVSEAARLLEGTLTDHNMKEEHILYPESDQFMSPAERTAVVKKAQTL